MIIVFFVKRKENVYIYLFFIEFMILVKEIVVKCCDFWFKVIFFLCFYL